MNDKDTGNEYSVKVELNHDPCALRLINTLRMNPQIVGWVWPNSRMGMAK